MSMPATAEADLLKLLFNNTTWAALGDTTGVVGSVTPGSLFISLHTADPGEAGTQLTSETAYTNYARVAVARSTAGWTVDGAQTGGLTQVKNAAAVTFAQCGATGATLTHFAIGKTTTGAGEILISGALTASLAVSNGITPSFAIGALIATCD